MKGLIAPAQVHRDIDWLREERGKHAKNGPVEVDLHCVRTSPSSPHAAETLAPPAGTRERWTGAVSAPQLEFAIGRPPPANNLLITYHDELWHASINKGLR